LLAALALYFHSSAPPRDLHSFPTRRSSDLGPRSSRDLSRESTSSFRGKPRSPTEHAFASAGVTRCEIIPDRCLQAGHGLDDGLRSEEHTSELQSRENLVCRLLLEKKKQQTR